MWVRRGRSLGGGGGGSGRPSHLSSSESSLSSLVGVALTPLFLARGQPDRLREDGNKQTGEGGSSPSPQGFPGAPTSGGKRSFL